MQQRLQTCQLSHIRSETHSFLPISLLNLLKICISSMESHSFYARLLLLFNLYTTYGKINIFYLISYVTDLFLEYLRHYAWCPFILSSMWSNSTDLPALFIRQKLYCCSTTNIFYLPMSQTCSWKDINLLYRLQCKHWLSQTCSWKMAYL